MPGSQIELLLQPRSATPNLQGQPVDHQFSRSSTPEVPSVTAMLSNAASKVEPIVQQQTLALIPLDALHSWVPKALRRISLVAFATVYISVIIVLAILFRYSKTHDGLASADAKLSYLWTYGPTAVFAIISAFWTKVEYHTKQLAPWRSLVSGPSLARQSLLLDYLSPWNIKALYSSVKSRRVDVALAVTGSLLLQLMIIFSTGLFALEQRTLMRQGVTLSTTTRFANVSEDITAQPFLKALAISQYGLCNPEGSTEAFAYQTVNVSDSSLSSNSTIRTIVDAFVPDLQCEVANATWRTYPLTGYVLDFGLYGGELNATDSDCIFHMKSTKWELASISGYIALNWLGNNTRDSIEDSQQCKSGPLGRERWRVWVGHVDLDNRNRTVLADMNTTLTYRDGTPSVACISCQPKLEVRKALLTMDGLNINATLIEDSTVSTLPNVSAWTLLQKTLQSADLAGGTLRGSTSKVARRQGNITLDGNIFELFNSTTPRYSPESWMDTGMLIESSRKAFQRIATQYVLEHLSEPYMETIRGTATYPQKRVVLRALSFYLITSLLVVLVAIAVSLCFHQPLGVVPRDPGSISGLAAIIASSPDINKTLRGVAHSSSLAVFKLASTAPFQSGLSQGSANRQFGIFAISSSDDNSNIPSAIPTHPQKWWRPFGVSVIGMLVVLVSPLAAIAVLEALYQRSVHSNGLVDIAMDEYSRYLWAYIPAIFVWGVNTSFEGLYFLSTVIQPYHTLRRRVATPSEALNDNLLGKILVHNAWSAMKNRRFAVLFSALAVLLGTVLPIAVAGLYTTKTVPHSIHILLPRSGEFNASQGFYTDDYVGDNVGFEPNARDYNRSGSPLTNQVIFNTLPFPRWTYETFALQQFNVSNSTFSSLSALVPAVRGRVNCTIAGDVVIDPNGLGRGTPGVRSKTSKDCVIWSSMGHDGGGQYTPDGDSHHDYYFGSFAGSARSTWNFSLPSPNYTEIPVSSAKYHGDFGGVVPLECPRAVLSFGKGWYDAPDNYLTGSYIYEIRNVTIMHCWPYVEQVVLNTTFGPNLDVKSAIPLPPDPSLDEGYPFFSEAEIVQNSGEPRPPREPPRPWEEYLTRVMNITDPSAGDYDLFLEAVIWGKDGIPSSELLGEDNAQRLLERVDRVYGIMMAQIYHTYARIDSAPNSAPLDGTAVDNDRFRVFQTLISTRILEGVLGAMFLCAAFAFIFLDANRLLPQNPCSIAGAASLLAGSKLVERGIMPDGAEFLSEKDLRDQLKGMKFLLGWWGEGGEKRFGIDVVEDMRVKHELVRLRGSSASISVPDTGVNTGGEVTQSLLTTSSNTLRSDSIGSRTFHPTADRGITSAVFDSPIQLLSPALPLSNVRSNSTTSAMSVGTTASLTNASLASRLSTSTFLESDSESVLDHTFHQV